MVRHLIVALLLLLPLPAHADAGARLVSLADLTSAIGQANQITLSAYTLSPHSRMGRALVSAARRGAEVSLVLDGAGMAQANSDNAAAAAAYSADGIRVRLTSFKLHMKAAVLDGSRVFVSDRNWSASRDAVILALPASARIQVERAMLGQPESHGTFATRKDAALALEASLLAQRRSHTLLVSTESFSRSPISDLLAERAQHGDDVTLVVAANEYRSSPTERGLVAALAHAGVHVFLGRADEKIAIDGNAGYVGSVTSQ